MNKFDSIISDLCEANGYPNQQQNTVTNNNQQQNTGTNQQQNTNQQQQNTNTNTNQQQQNTVTNQQQQKIDLQKLMSDFNNNTLSIKNIKDFEKYGLKAS
jgi:hypothetical protein